MIVVAIGKYTLVWGKGSLDQGFITSYVCAFVYQSLFFSDVPDRSGNFTPGTSWG